MEDVAGCAGNADGSRPTFGRRIRALLFVACVGSAFDGVGELRAQAGSTEWTSYGNDAGGSRYSPADQITAENVDRLEVAWIYRTGDYGLYRSDSTD